MSRWFVIIFLILSGGVKASPIPNAQLFASMLPVKTPSLTPGVAPKGKYTAQLTQPLFIVGADRTSHRWLERHQAYLKSINAMGMVVNVSTVRQLNRLMHYGLPLYPVRGDQWAEHFTLSHYPVLLENGEVKQ
ncbi:PFL_4695 family integrating conjugative element protein [Vibrio pectenicida]|uniref:Integrating conjugative element protein n=1 Tax=Vibrio pectenicida TaxID=62763 RepID=A0A3R9EDY1_9VIBR|nr:integrating conjugative element protein [Vibrio pectenicida]RSD31727.1 integrating conjugative element protein [Vibrio pectenicida]